MRTAEELAKEIEDEILEIQCPFGFNSTVSGKEIAAAIKDLAKERDELREWKRRAVEFLESRKFKGHNATCLGCRKTEWRDHAPDCELAALLSEATDG